MQLFTANFMKYGAKCKCDLKNVLKNYFSTILLSFDLHKKELSNGLPASQCYKTQQLAFKLEFLQLS